MNNEIGLREILSNLKQLSANELIVLQERISKHIYAKGVEDYLHALDITTDPKIKELNLWNKKF